jgi:hypothetical protein
VSVPSTPEVTIVRPGHPYRTDELAQKRSEQRRILRSIPDWIVANARLNRPGPRLADPDDALVERELRRLADRELEPLHCWLGVWRVHTETEMLGRWFADAEIGAALEDVAVTVHAAHEAWQVAAYPSGLFPAILRVVALLAWADDQAGDYVDPRLWRHHAAWRNPLAPRRTPRPRPEPPKDDEFWAEPRRRSAPRPHSRGTARAAPETPSRPIPRNQAG